MSEFDLVIRPMRDEDLDKISKIYKLANPFADEMKIEEWTRKNLQLYPDLCYTAVLNNEIVGGISGHIDQSISTIDDIAVKEEYQRRGIGSKLLRSVIIVLSEKKVKTVRVEVPYECRSAIQFYCRYGFKTSGYKKDYFGDGKDAIFLTKEMENIPYQL